MRISDWSSDVCSSDLKAYIDGAGTMLRNAPADDCSFLGLMREIHLTLVAGTVGHWILAVSGVLLFTNMSFRSAEHTSALHSLTPISYTVFCLKYRHTYAHNTHISYSLTHYISK